MTDFGTFIDPPSEAWARLKHERDRYREALERIAAGSGVMYSPALEGETPAMAQARWALATSIPAEGASSD